MQSQTTYNKLIGKIDGGYYFLDYTFDHGNFKGATGSIIEPLTEEQTEDRNEQANDEDNLLDLWKQSVECGNTTDSLKDWCEAVREEQGEDAGLDDSYRSEYMPQLVELLGEDAVYTTNCIGGGRCFDVDMQWDELYDQELWEVIKKFETK